MSSIVADEYFIARVRATTPVGKLQILGAIELVQDGSHQIEYNHTHHLALDNNNAHLRIDANAARMLQDIGAEFAQKLSVLIVDLNLMRGRAFRDYNVARLLHHCHSIWVEQLALAFAALSELELESTLGVEDLYAMRVRVRHDYVVVGVYAHLKIKNKKQTFHN